jgi:S-adenosylmethionine:diacylglycerol 3-amino-3-carboxypropyl transferase
MAGTGAGQNAASTARENSRRVRVTKAQLRDCVAGIGGVDVVSPALSYGRNWVMAL